MCKYFVYIYILDLTSSVYFIPDVSANTFCEWYRFFFKLTFMKLDKIFLKHWVLVSWNNAAG